VLSASLLTSAALTFCSCLAYAYAGRRMQARRVQGPARQSWNLFLAWWYAIAAVAGVSAVLYALAALGDTTLEIFIVGQLLSLLLVCVANFGLVYYLLTLYTGRWGLWKPLLVFYTGYYVLLLYDLSAGHPEGVDLQGWRTGLTYRSALPPLVASLIYSLLIVPPLVGAFAYAAMYARARERTSRYRIVLVATSILLWACVSVLIAMPILQENAPFQFSLRLVGLAVAFLLIAAHHPPAWVRRRYGIEAITSDANEP
jgi:hypothetical protein